MHVVFLMLVTGQNWADITLDGQHAGTISQHAGYKALVLLETKIQDCKLG